MQQDYKEDTRLYKPSVFSRIWKITLYNVIWSVIFFWAFWGNFTLDMLAAELDNLLMYGFTKIRLNTIYMLLSFWFMFRQFFKDINLIIYVFRMIAHDNDISEKAGCKRMYEGTEGTGKTLNTAFDTLYVACDKDRAMRLLYYSNYPFRDEKENDVDYKVLEESFNFYEDKAEEYLPHLMSNFPIGYAGRKNYEFTMDYFDQVKRPAEGMALALTELAVMLPNSQSKIPNDPEKDIHKMIEKSETLSLSRQWFDLTVVADEQRTGEVVLAFRSVVSSNYLLRERKKVLEAKFLKVVLSLLENRILKRKKQTSKFLAKFYTKLKTLVRDIGFYKFIYDEKESIQDNTREKDLSFVLSCDIPFEFDTRGERKNYVLYKDKPYFYKK